MGESTVMNETTIMSEPLLHDEMLDVSGLTCPLPILKTKKALGGLMSGQVLKVIATDPSTQRDFVFFTQQTGHILCHASQHEGQFIYWLQRK
jgi:tRNA 2-thiouridine synthesizing protein A